MAQTTDAAALVRSALIAINSGNADAYAALFAPNATLTLGIAPGSAPPFATGTAQIRQYAQSQIAAGIQNRLSGTPTVAGTAVTWAHLEISPTSQARDACVEVHGAAIVQNGLFQAIAFSDMSNETFAYCNALPVLTAGVAAPALRLPATGSPVPATGTARGLSYALAIASVAVVAAGTALSRRRAIRTIKA
jgi:hypothetical protein